MMDFREPQNQEIFIQYTKPGNEAAPWREGGLVPPGVTMMTIFMESGSSVRAERAERVDGIDYSAFRVCIFIGAQRQFNVGSDGWIPAEDLFKPWPCPMDEARFGIDVNISIVNASDKALPFAVRLIGR